MTSVVTRPVPGPIYRLSVEQYDAIVLAGLLEGQRVELLEGVLVEVATHSSRHADAVHRIASALHDQRPPGWQVRSQLPVSVPPASEPEPDVAVVRDVSYRITHPATALLVVEVSWSSLTNDIVTKPAIYAAAGIIEYWVVDLDDDVVYVHTRPGAKGYGDVRVHRAGALTSSTDPLFTLEATFLRSL